MGKGVTLEDLERVMGRKASKVSDYKFDPDLVGKQTITDAGQDDDIAEGKYDEMRKMAALGAALKALGVS